MESCQERTLGISSKVSEPMSKVIQDANLTHVGVVTNLTRAGVVVLLKAAIPQDKTMTMWYFSHQGECSS